MSLIVTAPAQRRVSGTRFFGIASPLVANGDRRAFLPRDVCDNEKALLGSNAEECDRCKLRRPRESSIKTITRKNFGRVPTSPTLLPVTKEQVAGFLSRWSRPTCNPRASLRAKTRKPPPKSIVCLIVPCFRAPVRLGRCQRSRSSRTQCPHSLTNIAAVMSLGSCSDAVLIPWSNVMRRRPASAATASAIRSGGRPMHSHPRRRPCT
jgi:hypothetical protein